MKNHKKIKICILTSVHPVFDTRIFHKQAKTLVWAGYNVVLVAQHNKNDIVDGIKIIALLKSKNRFYRILFLARKAYKIALKEKADIYHFHDPELLPWMVLLKKKTGAKIIYDVHEDIPKQILSKHWIPKFLRKFIAFVFNFFEKRVARKFDYIILAGDDIKIKANKKIVIRNYPFKNLIDFDNINKNYSKFIYIGTIGDGRCIEEIITSLHYVKKNIKLFIIGDCNNKKYIEKLEKATKKQKKHQIIFLDHMPYKNALNELQLCIAGFILLKPNSNNISAVSRNNKLYEYMSCATVVIASNFPLWKQMIEGNKCGICVNPLESKEIAKAIEYLIEHPREAKQMGENGRKAVLEKYNWENESKKLLKIYEKFSKK